MGLDTSDAMSLTHVYDKLATKNLTKKETVKQYLDTLSSMLDHSKYISPPCTHQYLILKHKFLAASLAP